MQLKKSHVISNNSVVHPMHILKRFDSKKTLKCLYLRHILDSERGIFKWWDMGKEKMDFKQILKFVHYSHFKIDEK